MDRRRFLALIGGALAAPFAVARQAGRKYRIGLLIPLGSAAMLPYRAALADQLAKHGFAEGRNLEIEARTATETTHEDRLSTRELLKSTPDALFTCTTNVSRAAQSVSTTVPIVFAWVADPVAAGMVQTFARPGGNTTGVTSRYGELFAKRLELALELVPGAMRIAIVGGFAGPFLDAILSDARKAASVRGVELLHVPFQGGEGAMVDAVAKGAQALLMTYVYGLVPISGDKIIRIASEKRIPVIFSDAAAVENGGLISFGTNLVDDVRRGADMLAKILRGANPATLPVDQAARFEMVINLKSARTLGLTIPQSILLRADRVIE